MSMIKRLRVSDMIKRLGISEWFLNSSKNATAPGFLRLGSANF